MREVNILEKVESPKENDQEIPVLKVPFLKNTTKCQLSESEKEIDDETTESESSVQRNAKRKRRSKERSDSEVRRMAEEISKEKDVAEKMKKREAFIAAEKQRKVKGPEQIPLRRSNRISSRTVMIKERSEDQPPVHISSSDEDDIL